MVSSSSGQSMSEVMADFDRIFGRDDGSAKNPMACRRNRDGENKEDKISQKIEGKIDEQVLASDKKSQEANKVFILLPEGIKSDEVLEKLGRSLGERYLMIISSFYSRGLLKKKVKNELGNYLAGDRKSTRLNSSH